MRTSSTDAGVGRFHKQDFAGRGRTVKPFPEIFLIPLPNRAGRPTRTVGEETGRLPNPVCLAPKDKPFDRVWGDKSISNVPFYPEHTMALFRANGPPRYQPWATPKETYPTD